MEATSLLAARCSLLAVGVFVARDALGQTGQWLTAFQHPAAVSGPVPSGYTWPSSFEAINLAVIPPRPGVGPNDVVIAWDNHYHAAPAAGGWYQRYTVGNPEVPGSFVNRFVNIPPGPNNLFLGDLFCSGHCWLPDGRLFIAGGNAKYGALPGGDKPWQIGTTAFWGSRYVGIWDPATNNWTHLADANNAKPMRVPRWYPTVTMIDTRHVMVSGGQADTSLPLNSDEANDTYELFDVHPQVMDWIRDSSNQPKLFDGPRGMSVPQGQPWLFDYPRLHLLSNNRVFCAGMAGLSSSIDPDPLLAGAQIPWSWGTPVSGAWSAPLSSGPFRTYGSSVLVPNVGNLPKLRDEVMIIAGSEWTANGYLPVQSSRRIVAPLATSWGITETLNQPRMLANPVLAPNGDIVLIGGSLDPNYFEIAQPAPVYRTEVWSRSGGWQWDAAENCARMYHSTAALLPSGNMVSAGSDIRTWLQDPLTQQWYQGDWQIYIPRNIANGQARPQWAGAWASTATKIFTPSTSYVVDFSGLPATETVSRFVLMRPCSTTHHSDMDQRYIELALTPASDGNFVQIMSPPAQQWSQGQTAQGSITGPPGYYMAFLVSTSGATSVARWVYLP